jgi:hypothetical protein
MADEQLTPLLKARREVIFVEDTNNNCNMPV